MVKPVAARPSKRFAPLTKKTAPVTKKQLAISIDSDESGIINIPTGKAQADL